jgi:hypothetical protein
MKGVVASLQRNAMDLPNWYPAIGGAAISAAPRIPIIKKIAKPASDSISAIAGKKAVL